MNRNTIKLLVILGLVIVAILAAYGYYQHYRLRPLTDDAYLRADVVRMAANVSGPIIKVGVADNQFVRKGELLFEIDPAPFKAAVEGSEAELIKAKSLLAAQEENVNAAQAKVAVARTDLALKETELKRAEHLLPTGAVSQQSFDVVKAHFDEAQAKLKSAEADLRKAEADRGDSGDLNYRIRVAQAKLTSDKLNLSYTRVVAPADGYVTNLNLPEGNFVNTGQKILTIVKNDSWFVYANFKETQLRSIRPGQAATIYFPAYPSKSFSGVVEGIAWAVLPQDYSSGTPVPKVDPTIDWVRLAQRFPVRVSFTGAPPEVPLRIGLTATVQIDTTVETKETKAGEGTDRSGVPLPKRPHNPSGKGSN
jgi:multidrug resistance efflux pump